MLGKSIRPFVISEPIFIAAGPPVRPVQSDSILLAAPEQRARQRPTRLPSREIRRAHTLVARRWSNDRFFNVGIGFRD